MFLLRPNQEALSGISEYASKVKSQVSSKDMVSNAAQVDFSEGGHVITMYPNSNVGRGPRVKTIDLRDVDKALAEAEAKGKVAEVMESIGEGVVGAMDLDEDEGEIDRNLTSGSRGDRDGLVRVPCQGNFCR